jgi:beta-glucanase (GH16 family)
MTTCWGISAFVLLAIAPSLFAQAPPQKPWKLTWSDEFDAANGTSVDPKKWQVVTGGSGWGNDELEYYTDRPENLRQQDGNLVVEARRENYTGPDSVTRMYTSARLKTQQRFTQRYGRFEARMRLPLGKGLWPAFWMLGDDHETSRWPACGEIDIMENIGDPHRFYGTLHGPGYSGGNGLSSHFDLPGSESVDGEFHLYAVEWEPDEIRFYADDHLYVTRTPKDLPADTKWVFDHRFYILLNLAVGGRWPGNPDAATKFPQQMLVDYVRVYAHE